MRIHLFLLFAMTLSLAAQAQTVAERLGYPANAKLVILHADDLGVAHSEDAASFEALDRHAVSSASIMVPTPWLTEVADYAKAHPDADLGLHLTLTSEWKPYRWGSVAPSDKVPSLLDPADTFYSTTEAAAAHAKPEEAEIEMRAQVERALAVGLHPTHLDSHMGTVFATPELFAAYVKVAHDYHLPFLVVRVSDERAKLLSQLSANDVIFDSVVSANPGIAPAQWKTYYLDLLKSVKPGLTYLIVHLGHDDSEMRAMMGQNDPFGAAWRQNDFDVVTSPEFQQALKDNHIVVIRWRDLQKLVNEK